MALGSLFFTTDTTGGFVTALTAESADGEVDVSLPSLLHWDRNVCPAFFPVQRLQLCSLSHLLLEIGGAAQAGKEEKQETGSLGPSAECHPQSAAAAAACGPGGWEKRSVGE